SSHPTSSIYNKSSYKEIKVSIILSFVISTFYLYLYIQKEVFIWVDSELKDVYEINNERTWAEQKESIITTLLPPLYKLVNKRYTVSNSDLLRMLHGRWRSRHRVQNIRLQGEENAKQNNRRIKKNTRMQDVINILLT